MWKIVGLIESRGGDVEVLPEWAVGTPNEFQNQTEANTVRDAMQGYVEKLKAERTMAAPGVGGSAGPSIRYMVLPAIDDNLIGQLRGILPPQPTQVQMPQLSFGRPQPQAT